MAQQVQLLLMSQAALWAQAQQLSQPWLSWEEAQRWQSLATPLRQREFLACRYGLRQVLALAGWHAEGLNLSAKAGCAPQLIAEASKQPVPQLSLAHSQHYVCCASAPCAVGVDLEVLPSKRLRNVREVAQLVCSPYELQMLDGAASAAEQTALFMKCWVLKEAWLKCLGTGIDFQRMTQVSCCRGTAAPANGRVLAHAHLWEARDLHGHQLLGALCTSPSLAAQDVAVAVEDGLSLSEIQSWRLLEQGD